MNQNSFLSIANLITFFVFLLQTKFIFWMLQIKTFCFNAFQERCCVAWDESGECVIIDPGFYTDSEKRELVSFISEKGLRPSAIILTHGHFDHIFGVSDCVKLYGVPVMMNPNDRVILKNNGYFCDAFRLRRPDADFETRDVLDGDKVTFGGRVLEAMHTPGHTPGGLCWIDRDAKVLFSGDTLFAGSIGRTDNQWGDYDALIGGIFGKLMTLDGDITVIPGHGPQTSIAEERTRNPFLQPFNEPFEDGEDQEEIQQ